MTENGRTERLDVDGWRVVAKWDPDFHSDGPAEMVVTLLPDASPLVRRRGLNTGALRRIERAIGDLIRRPENERETTAEFAQFLAQRVSELPAGGPRSKTGDYYGELLTLFEMIAATQPDPLCDLAEAMQMPINTVKSQLNRARRVARGGVQDRAAGQVARRAREQRAARGDGANSNE